MEVNIGDIVIATFGSGRRTWKVPVIVADINWIRLKATLLTADGTTYPGARLAALVAADRDIPQAAQLVAAHLTHIQQHNPPNPQNPHDQENQHDDVNNEQANDADLLPAHGAQPLAGEEAPVQDPIEEVEEAAVQEGDDPVEDPVADPVEDPVEEVEDNDNARQHVPAHDAQQQVVAPVQAPVEALDPELMCMVCFADTGPLLCASDCRFCKDCLFTYAGTLFQKQVTTRSPPCPLACGSLMSLQTMAAAFAPEFSDRYDRLVYEYMLPEFQRTTQALTAPTLQSFEADRTQLLHKTCGILSNSQTLLTPCCHMAFYEFQDCFAVQCAWCSKWFCAWCISPDFVFDNSHAAHRHVRDCYENPRQGAVYGDYNEWDAHCNKKKRKRLKETKQLIFNEMEEWPK